MAALPKSDRTLTPLEYLLLGFLAVEPQSGYALINQLEHGNYRYSASAGSVYPVLKRLEVAKLIDSRLEGEYETRPRKVYRLLERGLEIVDQWLRATPTIREVTEDFDLTLHKFLVMEVRFSREETIERLETLQMLTMGAAAMIQVSQSPSLKTTIHEQLLTRAYLIELTARQHWITEAIQHLRGK
jgi:DNA-binding PadR family transcriptional regulator